MNRTIEAVLKLSSKLGSMAAFDRVSGKYDDVTRKVDRYNRSQSTMARGASAAGAAMARYIGPAAVAAVGVNSVRMAGNFEDALFNIEKKAGATREEMDAIRRDVLDLAGDLPVSINEIAAAFERGAAAGIPLDDLMEFARLTVMVSDAWDVSAEQVGNTFAGFETGLGIAREDLEEFADLINYLADSGIADEGDIASFLDRVGASLANFGMTPEEIAAYGAALINLKMPAEIAARAMDTLSGKLAAPENLSEKSYNALQAIVGDIEQFRSLIAEDANSGLLYFLGELEKLDGQRRISLLGALMGEGFDDEVARIVSGLDEVERNLAAIEDRDAYVGSIAGLSERKLENLNSQLALMRNHWDAISISVGSIAAEPLADALGVVADHMTETAAIQEAVKDEGGSLFEQLWAMNDPRRFFSPTDETQRLARKGGYVYPGDEDLAKDYPDLYQSAPHLEELRHARGLLSGDLGIPDDPLDPRRVALPRSRPGPEDGPITLPQSEWSDLPPRPVIRPPAIRAGAMAPLDYPELPPHVSAAPVLSFGDLSDEADRIQQSASSADRLLDFKRAAEEAGGVLAQGADDAGAALAQGGEEAGAVLADSAAPVGQQIGDSASGALTGAAASIGAAIGQAAAAQIQTATDGAVRKLEGAAGRLARRRARGNPGRTMEDAGVAE